LQANFGLVGGSALGVFERQVVPGFKLLERCSPVWAWRAPQGAAGSGEFLEALQPKSFCCYSIETVPRFDEAGRGGFMRRFLTLVCLVLWLYRQSSILRLLPQSAGELLQRPGYGLTDSNVASIFLTPQTTGISLAFGQTQQIAQPRPRPARARRHSVTTYIFAPPTTSWWTSRRRATSAPARGIATPAAAFPTTPSQFSQPAAGHGELSYGIAYITLQRLRSLPIRWRCISIHR